MQRKLRTVLGLSAATAIAASGLIATTAGQAEAGVVCTTKVDDVPIRTAPETGAPVAARVPDAGTPFGCSGGPGWFRVRNLTTGEWSGYVGARFMDTSAG